MEAQEKYLVCMEATREFMAASGLTDVVIGLSGGIDSSVVAAFAVDALGAEHVHGVLLPGPYSSEHSVDDAIDLAERLGIGYSTVSITKPYEAFAEVLAEPCGGALLGTAAENTQARCRTVCIMALANAYNWVMLNTGNKSEAAMGYSTLYGDTAGMFAPIGGLYKTDVYAVARWRNEESDFKREVPPIPEHVLTKPPSAELAPGQKDESSLGISYDELDRILIAANEQGASVEDIVAQGFSREQVERVLDRYRRYAFKREMEPPFPIIDYEK